MTEADKAALEALAAQQGETFSDWARKTLLAARSDSQDKATESHAEIDQLREAVMLALREAMHAKHVALAWNAFFEDARQGVKTQQEAEQRTKEEFERVQATLIAQKPVS